MLYRPIAKCESLFNMVVVERWVMGELPIINQPPGHDGDDTALFVFVPASHAG